MMVTIAQLRAVLAILHIDPAEIGAKSSDAAPRGQGSERAVLVGLLHRTVSDELRRVITATMTDDEIAHAATMSIQPVRGENACEQADFDARWLRDRIEALAVDMTVDPAPVLLDAAARSTDAAAALLSLSRHPGNVDAEARWQRALTDLGQAYHLINDEYVGRTNEITAPLK
jgi:hypothetical protein